MKLVRRRWRAGLVIPLLVVSLCVPLTSAAADVVYLYDGLGRLVRVIDATGQAATYVYDPVGNILQIARQTGVPQDQTTLLSVDPPNGAQGSQVTLTFTGTNLVGATLPTLPAGMSLVSTSFSVSGNQDVLTMTVAIDPEFALGSQPLTLVSALGGPALPFSLSVVRPPPRVDRVIPPIVTVGSLVQIEGAAFDPSSLTASQVTVNGVALPVISARSDALIAQVPLGVTTGPVTVTTAPGSGVSASPLTIVPANHPQQNVVTATLQAPFHSPDRIAFSPDGTRAYVIGRPFGFSTGGVAVVDTVEGTVVAIPPISRSPAGVAVTPDGSRGLVTRSDPSSLVVLDSPTGAIVATVALTASPGDVVVSPDGRFAYVALAPPAVAVVDLQTLTEVIRIPLSGGSLSFVAVSPDGNTIYAIGGGVSVIDATTRTVTRTITASLLPQTFALDPVAQRLYIAGVFGCCLTVQALDLQAGTVLSTFTGGALALSPDRTRLYVFDGFAGGLKVLNTATLATVGTLPIPTGPPVSLQALIVSPDGGTVWLTSPGDNTVRVVNTQPLAQVATVPVGWGPTALGLVPGRAELYVLNRTGNTVSVIQTATNTVRPTALENFGLSQPLGLVVPADGSAAYVANGGASTTVAFHPTTGAGLATLLIGDAHPGIHLAPALSRNELYVGVQGQPSATTPFGVAVLDLRTRVEKKFLPASQPVRAMALSLDERRLYVATDVDPPAGCLGGGCHGLHLVTFDGATGAQLSEFSLFGVPVIDNLLIRPDGTRLYTLHPDGTVGVIDTGTQGVIATIPVGDFPVRFALDRPGRRLYVINVAAVHVVDTTTNQVVATVSVGSPFFPNNNVVFSLDGNKAYVAGAGVAVINTQTNTVTRTVGPISRAVAPSPDGQRVFATQDGFPGAVVVIDTATDQVMATIPVGASAAGGVSNTPPRINITFSPDGARAWVVNTGDDSISVIQ